jgi:hypothetical protein
VSAAAVLGETPAVLALILERAHARMKSVGE